MKRPADFVKLEKPVRGTGLAEVVRDTLRRVHDQEFEIIQIVDLVCSREDMQGEPRKRIADQVRTEVSRQVNKGRILVIRQGGIIGRDRVTGRYRKKV